MKHQTILALATLSFLSACASVPTPAIPDGENRVPMNSPAAIEQYKARAASDAAKVQERTAMIRQIDAMSRQMQDLRSAVVMLSHQVEQNNQVAQGAQNADMRRERAPTAEPRGAGAPKVIPVRPKIIVPNTEGAAELTPPKSEAGEGSKVLQTGDKVSLYQPTESINTDGDRTTFRYFHQHGQTAFAPSFNFSDSLKRTANDSYAIEIRGRTDADKANPIDKQVALDRALNARGFLMESGVAPTKIRVFTLSSGGHLADNSTPEGKALNRRVEIDAYVSAQK